MGNHAALALALCLTLTACGDTGTHSFDELEPHADGVYSVCAHHLHETMKRPDEPFCGATPDGSPRARLWVQVWGRFCEQVVYMNDIAVSRSPISDVLVQEWPTEECVAP